MEKLSNLQGWRADLAALGAGLLLPLALAPFYLWPLAVVGLALLFLLWLHRSPRQAARLGFLFGLGMFGLGVSWVYVSIHYFGAASLPLAALLTLLFVAFMALFPASFGYIALYILQWHRGHERRYLHIELLLLMPALWGLLEWVRGWFLTGFPWLNAGYSQIDSPLAGYAPLLGVYGVNWLVALSAGLLLLALLQGWRRAWPYASALLLVWGSGAVLERVEWTEPLGNPVKVSLVQGNIAQEEKWQVGQLQKTLILYTELTGQHWDSDIIIWPEAAVTTWYHHLADGYLTALELQARATHTDMLIGIPYYDEATSGMYNSVLGMSDGERRFYHKHHLAPFGDYLPFEHYLRGLIAFFDLPMSSFSSGPTQQAALSAAGHNVGVSICYEDLFGEEVIRALPAAGFLVNVSNDSWWGNSHGPHQHMQIAAMRALETGRPLLRATNNGITAAVDYRGHITQQLPQFTSAVLTTEVQPRRGATPYVMVGNTLIVGLLVWVLAAVLIWRWVMRRRQAA